MKHLPTEIPAIAEKLMLWYDQFGRVLPWRTYRNPYAIWLSEVILQQTRVEQGLSYWERFLDQLPTVESLAEARIEDVKGLWSGLGYYRRADLLHRGAQKIAREGWPKGYKEWILIPGIGPYTAAALASIVDGEAVPAIDGNAYRVFSRLANWAEVIETSRSKNFISSYALQLIHPSRPGDYNQAIMDLAQAICTPKKPKCPACPIQDWCEARMHGTAESLPIKAKKTKVITEDLHFAVRMKDDRFGLIQRPVGGIWSGLFTPPLLTTAPLQQADYILDHKLSHRHLKVHFHVGLNGDPKPEIWLTYDEWKAQGMPQVFVHWLTKFAYI